MTVEVTVGHQYAMRRGLKWFIHLLALGLSKGNVHPTYAPNEV